MVLSILVASVDQVVHPRLVHLKHRPDATQMLGGPIPVDLQLDSVGGILVESLPQFQRFRPPLAHRRGGKRLWVLVSEEVKGL